MRISVTHTASAIDSDLLLNKSAVMFDILRASSTVSTALANGCKEIIPVVEVEDAFNLAETLPEGSFLLGGERGAMKVAGFHLGNSPLEYSTDKVKDKTVILTTTNGTRAIRRAAEGSGEVLIGSILNASAVARELMARGQDVALVCAGTRGQFSLEDTLAAGLVLKRLLKLLEDKGELSVACPPNNSTGEFYLDEVPILTNDSFVLEDAAVAALRLAEYYADNPLRALQDSLHGQKLIQLGLTKDLAYCAQVDLFDVVPTYNKGKISLV